MPRYEFQGNFFFDTQAEREAGPTPGQIAFGNAVATYIASHPTAFAGDTPVNVDGVDHSAPRQHMQHVQAHLTSRQNLDALMAAMINQAQTRGAVVPSSMWLKQVPDGGGSAPGVQAAAPDWVQTAI